MAATPVINPIVSQSVVMLLGGRLYVTDKADIV